MSRTRTTLAVLVTAPFALAALAGPAVAAPSPKANQATCFDGASEGSGNGTCVRNGAKSFTLTNPAPGDYSGVYVESSSLSGMRFADITSLGFAFAGATSGGSPRYSIPIAGGGYVFVDAASCNTSDNPAASSGTVDPLHDQTCVVSGYDSTHDFYYPSWQAFLNGEPGITVANNYVFIVADQPGTVTLSNIELGRVVPGRAK